MSDSIAPNLSRVVLRFQNATQALHDHLMAAMETEVEQVAFYARARMTELFKNPQRMMESIETQVVDGTTFIEGTVEASGLPYLAIHEYGGVTSPHDIFPVNAKALHFFMDGATGFRPGGSAATNEVFTKVVHHPGSVMPERSYMRYALAQRRSAIRAAFAGAVAASLADDHG